MRTIKLDASGWATVLDFYDALLSALGAPSWHGRNANALLETMVHYDDINAISPPYCVRITNVGMASRDVQSELKLVEKAVQEGLDAAGKK
jgi:hypothetical protein